MIRDILLVFGVTCAVCGLVLSAWDFVEGRKKNGKDKK